MTEKIVFAALFGLCLGIITSVESDFIGECVYAHNKARIQHEDTPSIRWDAALADSAQKYANHLADRNKASSERNYVISHSNAALYGENIYAGTYGGFLVKKISNAMYLWYKEGVNYNYWQLAPWGSTGHFTQVIWKSTTSVGCGEATFFKNGVIHTILVCQYKPKGNISTQYLRNVKKLKKYGKQHLSSDELDGNGKVEEPQPGASSCRYTDGSSQCNVLKQYCNAKNIQDYCPKTCKC